MSQAPASERASAPEFAQASAAVRTASAPPGERDAVGEIEHGTDADVARLTHSFFSRPPSDGAHEPWDELPAPPMAHGARRAMIATLAIAGGFAVLLGGYLVYQRVIMPVPVELGAGASLPDVQTAHQALAAQPSVASAQAVIGAQPPAAAQAPVAPQAAVAAPVAMPATPVAAAVPAAPPVTTEVAAAAPAAAPAPIAAPGPSAAPAADAAPVPVAAPAAAAAPAPAAADVPVSPEVAAKLEEAHALYDRGRRADAITAYEGVLALQPTQPVALSRIAYLHLQAGDDARAREYAARAVELDATSSEGWIVLGAALEALRDRAGARAAYQQCAATGTGAYAAECKRLAR